jgi:hypothetical protein
MADMPPRIAYEQVLNKFDWAEKHIQKLDAVLREWRDANPIAVFIETNPETGEVTYYIENVPSIPSSVPLIAGDALYSFRAALDYLACGLAEVVTPDTKFPIAHSAEAYKSSLNRLVPGLRGKALEALNRIKPYQGGNLLLWQLHRLNIIDKHRLLLTMCVVNPAQRLAQDKMPSQESSGPKQIVCKARDGVQIIVNFVKKPPIPLHTGEKLLTVPASQAQKDVGFYFAVGINEPSISEGTPLNIVLDFISREVGATITKLSPFLLR